MDSVAGGNVHYRRRARGTPIFDILANPDVSDMFTLEGSIMSTTPTPQKALIIYVEATAPKRDAIADRLRAKGFTVEDVLVSDDVAAAIQAGDLPSDLKAMIERADLCVFLLPTRGCQRRRLDRCGDASQ